MLMPKRSDTTYNTEKVYYALINKSAATVNDQNSTDDVINTKMTPHSIKRYYRKLFEY